MTRTDDEKVPYMALIGGGEAEAAARRRGAGKKQEVLPRAEFVERLRDEIEVKALPSAD